MQIIMSFWNLLKSIQINLLSSKLSIVLCDVYTFLSKVWMYVISGNPVYLKASWLSLKSHRDEVCSHVTVVVLYFYSRSVTVPVTNLPASRLTNGKRAFVKHYPIECWLKPKVAAIGVSILRRSFDERLKRYSRCWLWLWVWLMFDFDYTLY